MDIQSHQIIKPPFALTNKNLIWAHSTGPNIHWTAHRQGDCVVVERSEFWLTIYYQMTTDQVLELKRSWA